MPLLDNLLDLRLWPLVVGYLACSIPVYRMALDEQGLSWRGFLLCCLLASVLVVLAYPGSFGLRFAPDLATLATDTRPEYRWLLLGAASLAAAWVPRLRNRHAGPLLSLWTLSLCVVMFSALRDYLHMPSVLLVPGLPLVTTLLLAVWLGQRLGRFHAAPGTAAFSILTLQLQVLLVLVYCGIAGMQLAM